MLCCKVVQGASGSATHAIESPTPKKLLIILSSLLKPNLVRQSDTLLNRRGVPTVFCRKGSTDTVNEVRFWTWRFCKKKEEENTSCCACAATK